MDMQTVWLCVKKPNVLFALWLFLSPIGLFQIVADEAEHRTPSTLSESNRLLVDDQVASETRDD